MQDLNDKITGNTLTATEWNEVPSEIQNVIEGLGQTLSSGDLDQLGKGIAGYVANSNFYTDAGIADAYVLTKIGAKQGQFAYTNGMAVSFLAGNDNTGASTVNVNGIGNKDIKLRGGGDPVLSDISGRITLSFDSANDRFELITPQVTGRSKNSATVADMTADQFAKAGQEYAVQDYETNHNSGVLFFKAVAGAASAPDGGSQIDHDSLAIHFVQNFPGRVSAEMFGASPLLADNNPPIQSAFDFSSTNYGGVVGIGAGSYTYLTTIIARFNSSLQGQGYSTRLLPVGVNGFDFEDSGIPACRYPFRDFWIQGDNTIGSIAFNVTVDDGGASKAIKGCSFDNVFVQNFEDAWIFTGAWNTTLTNCDTTNVWRSVNCLDRNVHIMTQGCSFVRGTTVVGYSGVCAGMHEALGGFGLRTEDIQCKDTLYFGFDRGISISNALYVDIEGCDVDFCVEKGIYLVTIAGGCSVKSNWVYTLGDNGIECPSLGTGIPSPMTISNNNIQRDTQGTLSGVNGIEIGTGRENVNIIDNHIEKFHMAAVLSSPDIRYTGNWDTSTNSHSLQFADTAIDCIVEHNKFEGTVDRGVAKPNIKFGTNSGILTEETIQIVMDAGVTSQVYTWASLGLPDGMINSSFTVFMNNSGATSMGNVRAVPTATQVTVYRDVAVGSPAGLDMYIKGF